MGPAPYPRDALGSGLIVHGQVGPATGGPFDVVVIGAGQAGLALGWYLQRLGASFAILDGAPEVGHSWRTRWDSLRLFTPARYDSLPGTPFPGDPDHHPTKDEVADFLREYAEHHRLPVRLGMPVSRLERAAGAFIVTTPQGTMEATQVVIATGAFHAPALPDLATALDPRVRQLHSSTYRSPRDVPDGPVMVVGASNSGLQIAQELAATHPVTVAVGTPPRTLPQHLLRRDIFWWLDRAGMITRRSDSLLVRRLRTRGELVIGTRVADLRSDGVDFAGRVTAVTGQQVTTVDGRTHTPATVIWATGFRPDWSWLHVPVLTERGELDHTRGVSKVPGLYFLGLPWQHSRGSSLLGWVQHDAAHIAAHLTARAGHPAHPGAIQVPVPAQPENGETAC